MNTLKKFLAFFGIALWALGLIGSTGYLFYYHQPLFAVASLAVAGLAFPTIKNIFKFITTK